MNAKKQHNSFFFLKNKKLVVLPSVYEPLEDSFLVSENIGQLKGKKVIDMGCGTGIQGITALFNNAKTVIFADKNKNALKNTKKNCKKTGFSNYKTVHSDLFENIKEKVDYIIFNPPYIESNNIRHLDLDGGKKGRETLDRFLCLAPNHLKKNGKIVFLQSSLNGIKKTKKLFKKIDLKAKIIAKKKLFFEELIVFEVCKIPLPKTKKK